MKTIELSLKQTILVNFRARNKIAYERKYSYKVKFPWICLKCKKIIFVSYLSTPVYATFHYKCYKPLETMGSLSTHAEYHYLRAMKNAQVYHLNKYIPDMNLKLLTE
jgi:hypothetical protein